MSNKVPRPKTFEVWDEIPYSETELTRLAETCDREYRYTKLKCGRCIHEPSIVLKKVQKALLIMLSSRYSIHPNAHAYCAGKNTYTATVKHVGRRTVVRVDIHNFFNSITKKMIESVLATREARRDAQSIAHVMGKGSAALVAKLCTRDGRLPVGAPSSPMISNMIMWVFDVCLTGMLNKLNVKSKLDLRYTRYADDIIISGKKAHHIIPIVYSLLAYYGFEPNLRKTKVMHRKHRQCALGYTLNHAGADPEYYREVLGKGGKWANIQDLKVLMMLPRIGRKYKRKVRAEAHQLRLYQRNAPKGKNLLDYNTNIKEASVRGKEAWIRINESGGLKRLIK